MRRHGRAMRHVPGSADSVPGRRGPLERFPVAREEGDPRDRLVGEVHVHRQVGAGERWQCFEAAPRGSCEIAELTSGVGNVGTGAEPSRLPEVVGRIASGRLIEKAIGRVELADRGVIPGRVHRGGRAPAWAPRFGEQPACKGKPGGIGASDEALLSLSMA